MDRNDSSRRMCVRCSLSYGFLGTQAQGISVECTESVHQGITSLSRQKSPVLSWGASAASHTIPAAPSSTERGALEPPISVRHHPGHTELTAIPFSLRAAPNRQVMALSVVLEAEYAGDQLPISMSWPAPLETLM